MKNSINTAKTPKTTKKAVKTTEVASPAEVDDFTAMMSDADITPEVTEAESAPVVVKAQKAPKGNDGLTLREIAILKAIKSSTFADPETGSVPSFTLEMDTPVELGKNRVNTPIPGLVASLNKKGAIVTFKIKGQTMIELTVIGEEFLEMLK